MNGYSTELHVLWRSVHIARSFRRLMSPFSKFSLSEASPELAKKVFQTGIRDADGHSHHQFQFDKIFENNTSSDS